MSFTLEIYELLIQYAKDYQGKEVTLQELRLQDWYKCVWGSWRAQAYYKMNGIYERLEDVPEGLKEFSIFADGHTQSMDIVTCEKIYGRVI